MGLIFAICPKVTYSYCMNEKVVKQKLQEIITSQIRSLVNKLPVPAEVFVVGGAVRDALLRKSTKDIDIVVRNVAPRTLQRTLKSMGAVELVGKNFGVFKWTPRRWKGEAIDVALPRTDHAFNTGGYKDVKTQSDPSLSIEKDVKRRDYTVNALAYNIKKRQLEDYVGGVSDLASKTLRTVGDPVKRFREDFTRMLRGVRFSIQLGFALEAHTAKVLRIMMHHVNDQTSKGEWKVPREMVAKELVRMFVLDPVRAFDASYFFHVFDELIPEMMDLRNCPQPAQYHVEGDVMQHTRAALEHLQSVKYKKLFGTHPPSALLIFSVLFHDIGKPVVITFPEPGSNDRIRYNNHDTQGAESAGHIARRLHLSVYAKENASYHIDADKLAWLVRNHLIGFRNGILAMKPSTIEKYYFNGFFPSEELLRMQFVDTMATVGPKRKPDVSGFTMIYRTVKKISRARKDTGVRSLLTGDEIIEIKKIAPGPEVGGLLSQLRNVQLQGRVRTRAQAVRFIKSR